MQTKSDPYARIDELMNQLDPELKELLNLLRSESRSWSIMQMLDHTHDSDAHPRIKERFTRTTE